MPAVFLMKAFCMLHLMYAMEAVLLSGNTLKMLDNVISNSIRKIFGVCNNAVVLDIRRAVELPDI